MNRKQRKRFEVAYRKFIRDGMSEPAARRYAYAEATKK